MNLRPSGSDFVARDLPPSFTPGDKRDEPVQIACFDSLADVACLWLAFQQQAQATAYHCHQWAEAWQSTIGAKLKVRPKVLAGFGRSGGLLFLLPMQFRRKFGLTILEWHGSPDAPYGHGLFADRFLPQASAWFAEHLDAVLAKAGAFDLLNLANMPETMFGEPHPLSSAFNIASPNETYMLNLGSDFETVYKRKRNAETRRANRRKDNRMLESGELQFRHVTEPAELKAVIDVMLEHKIARLAAEGIHDVFDRETCEMVHKLSLAPKGVRPVFSTHVLSHQGTIVACTFGGWLNGTYWYFISSIGPDSALTKHSPGDHALRKTIEACCQAGMERFDFGAGSAPYKVGWTDETIRLFSTLRASNLVALPFVGVEAGVMLLKATIKRHPRLKALAFAIRRSLRARRLTS